LQNKNTGSMGVKIRKAGNRGRFYPFSPVEIANMIEKWNIADGDFDKTIIPKAIISPHAGYIYSGYTANKAHRFLPLAEFDTIVVIGPSHHVRFRGISASFFDSYETPFGLLDIDTDLLDSLNKHYNFTFSEDAHFLEHSTETQMPFIAYYHDLNVKVVELVYGMGVSYVEISRIIRHLFVVKKEKIGVVISTDLSHYHNSTTAQGIDSACLKGVEEKNISLLQTPCEACGKMGLIGIVKAANELDLKTKVLSYTNSGDVTGDYLHVVGYMSAIVY
jgi:AmmeMemoRadiSam system protein B